MFCKEGLFDADPAITKSRARLLSFEFPSLTFFKNLELSSTDICEKKVRVGNLKLSNS